MKKNSKIIICIIVVMFLILFNFFDYQYNQLPNIILEDDLTVDIGAKVTTFSFIKKIENGTIISKEKNIDTMSPGKKEVILIIENNYGKKREYKYFIEVIEDTD